MPQTTKTFRVFVSSTFTDMREERRILQKDVFPRLKALCESKGASFQDVDLRWGVNEEASLDQKTMDICLNEIARCQKLSPKPNFIILLGDKYGWQPIPTRIPQKEMDIILPFLNNEDKKLIQRWYWLDDNAIPPEYILQPRTPELKEYSSWAKIEIRILELLRGAVSSLPFDDKQLIKYFSSATHQEIIGGALNPPEGTENPEEHVFAFIRETRELPEDKSAEGLLDLKEGKRDKYAHERLEDLKKRLKEKLGANCTTYPAEWKMGTVELNLPKEFADTIYKKLKDIIEDQLEKVIPSDEITDEVKLHREFMERLTEFFSGRQDILGKMDGYLKKGRKTVFSLIGQSGTGKSSVMAKAVFDYQCQHPDSVVVYRFIGTTSSSSNIISLLQGICGQIAKEFNMKLEWLAGEGRERMLHKMNGITEIFRKCLALGTAERPVVICLDALDQLSDSDNARALHWIPRELSENTRFIVSSSPDLENKLGNTSINHLQLLPIEEAEQILCKWFAAISRMLTSGQKAEVLEKFNLNKLPIYLKIAFEQTRHWHSFDTDMSLHGDVPGMINNFFNGLEKEHTRDFVEHVICYMLCGRYQGLTEDEILEILVFDKEYWAIFLKQTHESHRFELEGVTRIPIVVWSRLYHDLDPFLTTKNAHGVPIITFFHRQFNEVLRARYGLDEKVEK